MGVSGGAGPPYLCFAVWMEREREQTMVCEQQRYLTSVLGDTVCPRSSDPFYVVTYYIKWVATSWTYSMFINFLVVTRKESMLSSIHSNALKWSTQLIWAELYRKPVQHVREVHCGYLVLYLPFIERTGMNYKRRIPLQGFLVHVLMGGRINFQEWIV